MKTSAEEIRELALENVRDEKKLENKEVMAFIDLMKYYCVETNTTESEVLVDDQIYNRVFNLFKIHKQNILK